MAGDRLCCYNCDEPTDNETLCDECRMEMWEEECTHHGRLDFDRSTEDVYRSTDRKL